MQERRATIKAMLAEKPFISLHDLKAHFPELSDMTLRREIEYFERRGDAIKVRGGMRSMKFITTSMEDSFHKRLGENTEAKARIAERAIDLIGATHSLFLDSGTTILNMATLMPDERRIITTTGPNIALELIKKAQLIVNLVGGMINRENISISGNLALDHLASINIDLAFIVPSGLSAKDGLSCGNYAECELKRMVIEKARRVVVLMDSTKLDRCLPFTFSRLDQIHTLITDADLPADIRDALTAAGVELIVV